MKNIIMNTTYDEVTRELRTLLTLNGFVDTLPNQVITVQQTDTLTMFTDAVMSPMDLKFVSTSVARALQSANVQLAQWRSAEANQDKAGDFIASSIDPVAVFDAVIIPPQ